jgi:riboflavin kinase/FMN adenylyltransferase
VGEGFRFGAGGKGNVSTLRELGLKHGFQVREVAHVEVDGHKISTSEIRQLLDQGRVETANLLLGRNHATRGEVEHGRKLGRKLGYPTANLSRSSEGYLPADGVYAGYLIADGVRYPAAHSVGTNDSIEAVPRLLESHVIGRDDLDLYGKTVVCEYVAQVRGWAKFESIEQLTAQIAADVAKAKQLLAE